MKAPVQRPQGQETVSQEGLLLSAVDRIARSSNGWAAVHLHLSKLRPHNRQDGHLRIVQRILEPLIQSYRDQLFLLSNSDIMILCRDSPLGDIQNIVHRLRALFAKDPLTYADQGDGRDHFCSTYDLGRDFAAFQTLAERLNAEARRRAQEKRGGQATTRIDPKTLGAVLERMAQADISRLIRRQAAVDMSDRNAAKVEFHEFYVSIADLQRAVAPQTNLLGDRWLFQHLTQTLDQRMLAMIARLNLQKMPPGISLNLNLSTVHSPGFRGFMRWLGDRARLVVEVQVHDIMADLERYFEARDILRAQGHRILIDGVTLLTLRLMDITEYDADLIKIHWSPDLAEAEPAAEIAQAFAGIGWERGILGRCDTETAVHWGIGQGFTFLQGRYIDAILAAVTMSRCDKAAACTLQHCVLRHGVIASPVRAECGNLDMLDASPVFRAPRQRT